MADVTEGTAGGVEGAASKAVHDVRGNEELHETRRARGASRRRPVQSAAGFRGRGDLDDRGRGRGPGHSLSRRNRAEQRYTSNGLRSGRGAQQGGSRRTGRRRGAAQVAGGGDSAGSPDAECSVTGRAAHGAATGPLRTVGRG